MTLPTNRLLPSQNSTADATNMQLSTNGMAPSIDLTDRLSNLACAIQSLPTTVASHIETSWLLKEDQENHKVKKRQEAIATLLNEAEERAQARETRLRLLLAEVRTQGVQY